MNFEIIMALASCVATAVERARLQMDDRLGAMNIVETVQMLCVFHYTNPTHPTREERRESLRTLWVPRTLETYGVAMFERAVHASAVQCAAMNAAAWLAWGAAHVLAKEIGVPPPHCKRVGSVRSIEMSQIYCCSVAGYTGHDAAEIDAFVYFVMTGKTRTADGKEWV